MIIALASPRVATTIDDGLAKIERSIMEAAAQQAKIVCFPEAYLPGLRGLDFDVSAFDSTQQEHVLQAVSRMAKLHRVTTILGMEWLVPEGRQIASTVIGSAGEFLGVQPKCQLDPTEEPYYVPGHSRQLFEVDGVRFGIAICHEAFRYPETVRWASTRGAKVVFHPHCTGSDKTGVLLSQWGSPTAPYYEKAMMCRALENTIYFASVNYAFRYQESATSLLGPTGECMAHLPYGQEGVLVQNINLELATGLLASRYAPQRYQDSDLTIYQQ